MAETTRGFPGGVGAVVSEAGCAGSPPLAAAFLTVAVTVLVARRVPLSLTARTWKVWEPSLTLVESQKPSVSPNGGLISDSTCLPSTRNWIEPGSSSTLSPFLSYTPRQPTVPDTVDPFAIVCDTAPDDVGVVAAAFLTVAVTVLVARRVPLSLTARTWKVWVPSLTLVESQKPSVSPNGGLISDSTCLPSTRNWIEPGSSSTLSPFLSYTPRQPTVPDTVDPFAIVCDTAPDDV